MRFPVIFLVAGMPVINLRFKTSASMPDSSGAGVMLFLFFRRLQFLELIVQQVGQSWQSGRLNETTFNKGFVPACRLQTGRERADDTADRTGHQQTGSPHEVEGMSKD
jgi:hypothetical protein